MPRSIAALIRRNALIAIFSALAVLANAATESSEGPALLSGPPPEYPAEMKRQQINGVVILVVSVNKLGFVEDCTVKKSSQIEFEQPAMDAVRNWVFRPRQEQGHAVPAEVIIPVKFAVES